MASQSHTLSTQKEGAYSRLPVGLLLWLMSWDFKKRVFPAAFSGI